ncbi:MAG TPA: hypothetical protein VH912_23605 [Streptosporangiaceae bacterium]|jgi:hypothetical protein
MSKNSKDLREKVAGKAEDLVAKAEAKGLSRERAAEVRDEVRAKGEQAFETSVEGARQVAEEARRNKAAVIIVGVVAAVVAVLLAGWRIGSRGDKS